MMRKLAMTMTLLLALGLLTACGSSSTEETESKDVSLSDFYAELCEEYHWTEDAENSQEGDLILTTIDGEMLESYYPGLGDVAAKQLLVKAPLMSSVVNELVLMECETADDTQKAVEILQARVDAQAEGGAWYPESMEAWGKAKVVQNGNYVAMIASAEHQDEIVEEFNDLFA